MCYENHNLFQEQWELGLDIHPNFEEFAHLNSSCYFQFILGPTLINMDASQL